jgi:hypothetical protein
MTTERLKELLAKATVGEEPWRIVEYGDGDSLAIHYAEDWRVCFMATPGDSRQAMERIVANAELIVEAVNSLPALIARVEEVEAALRPFAREADLYAEGVPDDLVPTIHCIETDTESLAAYTVGDLRRAAALREQRP